MWKFVVVHPVSYYTPSKKHNLPTLHTTSILPLERQDLKKKMNACLIREKNVD